MKKLLCLCVASLGLAFVVPVLLAAEGGAKAAADLSGTWDAVVETSQGSGTPVFVLKQEGAKLSGQYRGQLGDAPLTGTVKGNTVTFSFSVTPGEDMKVEYTGTVDGDTMSGKSKFGSEGEGTFTAKKRAAK